MALGQEAIELTMRKVSHKLVVTSIVYSNDFHYNAQILTKSP